MIELYAKADWPGFKNRGYKMCTSNSWRKSTPTARWQSIYTKKAIRSTSGEEYESVFQRLTWDTRRLKIDGEYFNHHQRENQGLKMHTSKTKVMMEKRHTNICQQHSDRERWKLHLSGTEIQHQRQKQRQGDSKKNHGRMDSTRQTPRHKIR